MFYQHDCEAAPEERTVYLQGAEAGHAAPDVLRKQKQKRNMLVGWFWGALFPRTANPIFHEFLCLHPIPLQGYVPRPFISISLSSPDGDSIQVLPAVIFWKCGRYRLSYRGWANKILHLFTSLGMQGRHNISNSIDKYTSRRYVPPKMVIKARFQKSIRIFFSSSYRFSPCRRGMRS